MNSRLQSCAFQLISFDSDTRTETVLETLCFILMRHVYPSSVALSSLISPPKTNFIIHFLILSKCRINRGTHGPIKCLSSVSDANSNLIHPVSLEAGYFMFSYYIKAVVFAHESFKDAWVGPTWKEEKKRSMKSLVRRRPMVLMVDSSVTKMKTTWWIPSRGIRVSVDFANLRDKREREGTSEKRERSN